MDKIRKFRWQQWLIVLGLALSLALMVFFTVRAMHFLAPQRRDEPIRPWMTIPYIAKSNKIPEYVFYQALGIARIPHDRRPLMQIAREQKRPIQDVIKVIETTIVHSRPPYPTPPMTPSVKPMGA